MKNAKIAIVVSAALLSVAGVAMAQTAASTGVLVSVGGAGETGGYLTAGQYATASPTGY